MIDFYDLDLDDKCLMHLMPCDLKNVRQFRKRLSRRFLKDVM